MGLRRSALCAGSVNAALDAYRCHRSSASQSALHRINGEGRVYRVPLGGVDYGHEAEGRFLRAVQRQLRAQPYDVVVAGDPLSVLAASYWGRGLKIVYCLRELRSAELTDFGQRLREALDVANTIVVPSVAAMRELEFRDRCGSS